VTFTDANTGWAVGPGILHTINGGATFVGEEVNDEIPTKFLLSNNYPNPFNPSTKIKYSIPQSSNVIIKVFDILGNEIETLANEEKQTGTYDLTWYSKNLPSGVYFYQLRAGEFVQTRKMLLLK
ncbi:MAG: T9SS type A sorting domain-containing protein, partial [Ignavibacteriaceae bacterium]